MNGYITFHIENSLLWNNKLYIDTHSYFNDLIFILLKYSKLNFIKEIIFDHSLQMYYQIKFFNNLQT